MHGEGTWIEFWHDVSSTYTVQVVLTEQIRVLAGTPRTRAYSQLLCSRTASHLHTLQIGEALEAAALLLERVRQRCSAPQ